MLTNLTLALAVMGSSVAAALIALLVFSALAARHPRRPKLDESATPVEPTVFLFDDRALVDATAPGRALIDAAPLRGDDWARLAAFLAPRFEGFETRLAALAEAGEIELHGRGEAPLQLRAEMVGELARITLTDPGAEGQGIVVDGLSQRALEDELATLRGTLDAAPVLIWRQETDGAVTWANRGYLLLSDALEDEDGLTWPLPALFETLPLMAEGTAANRRLKLVREGHKPAWFECHSIATAGATLNFAMPADAAVGAETSLREFVQTLTKTFAHLPIGLAIFDRQRRLQLFNPALIDLTALGADFLTGRPTLFAFLDRLRETRMMPEPKDYRSWRQQMAELEKEAATGLYEDTWALPSGQTYRVSGRPHPEGAVAILIEDISAEVSLTRRFRSELEMSQTVIDAMDEAIAVFSTAGVMILSNVAYARLWGQDPGATLGDFGIAAAMATWQVKARPNPAWADARDFVTEIGPRSDWIAEAELRDGTRLDCRFVPLAGGATLAGFRAIEAAPVRRPYPEASAKPAAPEAESRAEAREMTASSG